jgi:hypothetical protein
MDGTFDQREQWPVLAWYRNLPRLAENVDTIGTPSYCLHERHWICRKAPIGRFSIELREPE